jgi:hypothetical protein
MTQLTRPTSLTRLAQVQTACARLVDLLADRPLPAGLVAAPAHAKPPATSYEAGRERPEEKETC